MKQPTKDGIDFCLEGNLQLPYLNSKSGSLWSKWLACLTTVLIMDSMLHQGGIEKKSQDSRSAQPKMVTRKNVMGNMKAAGVILIT